MSDGKFVGRQPCSQGEKNSKFIRKCWRKTLGRTLKAVQGQQKQDCLPISKLYRPPMSIAVSRTIMRTILLSVNRSIHVPNRSSSLGLMGLLMSRDIEGLSDWSQMGVKKVDLRVSQVEHHKILISFFSYVRHRYITVWIWPKSELGHNTSIKNYTYWM